MELGIDVVTFVRNNIVSELKECGREDIHGLDSLRHWATYTVRCDPLSKKIIYIYFFLYHLFYNQWFVTVPINEARARIG